MTYRMLQAAIGLLLVCLLGAETMAQAPAPHLKTGHELEAAVFQKILNRARFENDGTAVEESEAVVSIQSQAGVKEFGQLIFGYSSGTEKLDIEYVRVRKPDGQVVVTPQSTAQDFAPDVLKEAPMYSDYRQRHISVAGLRPGDTLEYRTVTRTITPLAGANFWYEHTFPKGVVVNEDRLEIDVPKRAKSSSRRRNTRRRFKSTATAAYIPGSLKGIEPELILAGMQMPKKRLVRMSS